MAVVDPLAGGDLAQTVRALPDAPAFKASRYADPVVARGAYLVEALGHCGSCHTPRAITLQEEALDDSSDLFLSGGQRIGGWVAVNLRGNPGDGLGNWSTEDIVATLRTARNAEQSVIGAPMSEVVIHSTQSLHEADSQAIAAYLKTLAPAAGRMPTFTANPATAAALAKGTRLIAARNSTTITAPHATIPTARGARMRCLRSPATPRCLPKIQIRSSAWCWAAAPCPAPHRRPRLWGCRVSDGDCPMRKWRSCCHSFDRVGEIRPRA